MLRSTLNAALLVTAVALLSFPRSAYAGGFYLTDRGVVPLSRGGAFVAGARGVESLWYNPAGLKGVGTSFRAEGTVTLFDASFTRVDDAGVVKPKVDLRGPLLPIPLLGFSNDLGSEDWDFAAALFAPNAQPYRWPSTVDGMPAPQRYSLLSTDKSVIVHLAAGGAYSGIENLSLGAGVQLITGRFYTQTVLSACDRFVCAPRESPEFDSVTTVDLNPFLTGLVSVGLTYQLPFVKVGASLQTPYNIRGQAKLKAELPQAVVFDRARVDGDEVELKVPFPATARIGFEFAPISEVRVELSGVYEGWSRQDQIDIKPKDVWMRDVTGIADYQVGPISLQRDMQDVWSVRFGGEYTTRGGQLSVRSGLAYENGAFTDKTLSPITLDSDKLLLSAGASVSLPYHLSLDVMLAHVFISDRNIDDSEVTQPTALRPPPKTQSHIANGRYEMEANVFGLGLGYQP